MSLPVHLASGEVQAMSGIGTSRPCLENSCPQCPRADVNLFRYPKSIVDFDAHAKPAVKVG